MNSVVRLFLLVLAFFGYQGTDVLAIIPTLILTGFLANYFFFRLVESEIDSVSISDTLIPPTSPNDTPNLKIVNTTDMSNDYASALRLFVERTFRFTLQKLSFTKILPFLAYGLTYSLLTTIISTEYQHVALGVLMYLMLYLSQLFYEARLHVETSNINKIESDTTLTALEKNRLKRNATILINLSRIPHLLAMTANTLFYMARYSIDTYTICLLSLMAITFVVRYGFFILTKEEVSMLEDSRPVLFFFLRMLSNSFVFIELVLHIHIVTRVTTRELFNDKNFVKSLLTYFDAPE
ncbi:hypothetical protein YASMINEVIRUS_688 [Yasminevirus sp. GU-2018]|uniref:Uncharacterized protein n=1 Tax=Yasminevirus sp. GU-2018 TaxID=2420051 RepID=A0A5K0U8V5_9VIRU|nr:hypothetical protein YASMINEVIRUS_688 [Yasminevirus sp. GU-2018]